MEPFLKKRRRTAVVEFTKKGDGWGPVDRDDEGDGDTVVFWLDKGKTSWVEASRLPDRLIPDKETFQALWDLHPAERGKIRIAGREIFVPRWQQAYGRSYRFTGMNHPALPVPAAIAPWLDHARKAGHLGPEFGAGCDYNQILLNWYADGNHRIGAHSDDTRQMRKTARGETLVYSISLYDRDATGLARVFRLKPKGRRADGKPNRDRIDVTLSNGLVLVMGGLCQDHYTHEVPGDAKQAGKYARRVNITARCFKDEGLC